MIQASALAMRRAFGIFRERLLAGFIWSVLSTVAMQGSVLLTGVVLARMLGLEAFGTYALLASTVMTLAGVAQGGVGLISTKFVGEWLHVQPERISRVLLMCARFTMGTGAVSALALLLLAPVVAHELLGKPQVELHLRWVALATLFHVMATYQLGALQGFGAFQRISRAGVVAGLSHLALACMGAWLAGLTGALIGFAVAAAGRWWFFRRALAETMADHGITKAARIEQADWRLIWTFALPASLASLVTLPCLWGVTVLVARQPEGLAWVALFAVAHQLRQAVLQLPILLNSVSFSVLSRLKGQGEGTGYRQVFWTNMAIGVGFSAVVVSVLAPVADQVLGLYGSRFTEGRSLLLVLLLAVLPEMAGITAYQLVQSSGRMWRSLLLIVGPRDLAYLGLAAALLPVTGLPGAGWAYLAAYSFGCLATVLVGRGGGTLPLPTKATP